MNTVTNKNILSSFIQECIDKKDNDKIKTIVKQLNRDKMLSEAYFAIDNLQYGIVKENVRKYIIDHINILRKNKKALKLMETSNPYYATSIDEDIEYLLKNKKTAKNYNIWESKIFNIVSHIQHNAEITSKTFNKEELLESLKRLPENHKNIIKNLTIAEDKQDFYGEFKKECLLKINALLKEEKNSSHKLLLYEVKEQVNNLKYHEKTYVKDIVKINRINEMLSE